MYTKNNAFVLDKKSQLHWHTSRVLVPEIRVEIISITAKMTRRILHKDVTFVELGSLVSFSSYKVQERFGRRLLSLNKLKTLKIDFLYQFVRPLRLVYRSNLANGLTRLELIEVRMTSKQCRFFLHGVVKSSQLTVLRLEYHCKYTRQLGSQLLYYLLCCDSALEQIAVCGLVSPRFKIAAMHRRFSTQHMKTLDYLTFPCEVNELDLSTTRLMKGIFTQVGRGCVKHFRPSKLSWRFFGEDNIEFLCLPEVLGSIIPALEGIKQCVHKIGPLPRCCFSEAVQRNGLFTWLRD